MGALTGAADIVSARLAAIVGAGVWILSAIVAHADAVAAAGPSQASATIFFTEFGPFGGRTDPVAAGFAVVGACAHFFAAEHVAKSVAAGTFFVEVFVDCAIAIIVEFVAYLGHGHEAYAARPPGLAVAAMGALAYAIFIFEGAGLGQALRGDRAATATFFRRAYPDGLIGSFFALLGARKPGRA